MVVDGGRIVEVARHGSTRTGEVVDLGRLVVSPGLVDSHVHFNQPGRTHWEGFETGTAAALAGGTTTVVDMPLNSVPPTCEPAALEAKRREASGVVRTDVAFWGGIVPGSIRHVEALARAGVRGFKVFLVDSGVPEFPPLDETELREALESASAVGLPVLVHAELPGPMAAAQQRFAQSPPEERRRYTSYLASDPPKPKTRRWLWWRGWPKRRAPGCTSSIWLRARLPGSSAGPAAGGCRSPPRPAPTI